jgi:probable addiction module antidote protein
MKALKKSSTIPLDEVRLEYLRDPKHASYAMKLALEEFEQDNDVDILLDTLRLVAQAQGGLAALARKTHVSRQALHEALSPEGNPRLRTFQSVLGSLGLRMSVKPVKARTAAKRASSPPA